MSRHLFFGANTPDGFYQCFEDILFLDEAQKIIYLKGSSGCGKSTLMRKVAKAFENLGSRVDYIHCSNNTTDLDGICVRDYGIAVIDATAPHVCDPKVPVAIDEILNLADFIDEDSVKPYAKDLLKLGDEKKPFYEKAYRCLSAAFAVSLNNRSIRSGLVDRALLTGTISRELASFNQKIAAKPGSNRRMFASAVTPQGLTNYLDTMLDGFDIIRIDGEDGTGTEILIDEIKKAANKNGLDTETCYCAWDVQKAEHLFIPELHVCYLTKHEYCPATGNALRTIDLNKICNTAGLIQYSDELDCNKKLFDGLLAKSTEMMAAQKTIHDRIESIYIQSVDFDGINKRTNELITRLTALPQLFAFGEAD